MSETTDERLQHIFRAVFELPPSSDVTRLRQMSHSSWDSLAHVFLVTAIESEFGLTINAAEQLRMTSFTATVLLLEEKAK